MVWLEIFSCLLQPSTDVRAPPDRNVRVGVSGAASLASFWSLEARHGGHTKGDKMTMRDLDRLKCIQGVVDRQLRPYQAAERLGLTTRQVRRLVRRYEQEGPVGLISRLRNRPSGAQGSRLAGSLDDVVEELSSLGLKVLIIAPIPEMRFDVPY